MLLSICFLLKTLLASLVLTVAALYVALLTFLPPLHIVFLENTPQRVNKAFAYCLFKIDQAKEVVEPGIFGFFVP